jgi:hypothetical protein
MGLEENASAFFDSINLLRRTPGRVLLILVVLMIRADPATGHLPYRDSNVLHGKEMTEISG